MIQLFRGSSFPSLFLASVQAEKKGLEWLHQRRANGNHGSIDLAAKTSFKRRWEAKAAWPVPSKNCRILRSIALGYQQSTEQPGGRQRGDPAEGADCRRKDGIPSNALARTPRTRRTFTLGVMFNAYGGSGFPLLWKPWSQQVSRRQRNIRSKASTTARAPRGKPRKCGSSV